MVLLNLLLLKKKLQQKNKFDARNQKLPSGNPEWELFRIELFSF
jgi:hypothetical protein